MNGWTATLERKNVVVAMLTGELDPFKELVKADGAATVSCTYSRMLVAFGGEKLGFSVTLSCDQNAETIQRAGERAMLTVLEMLGQGVDFLSRLDAEATKGG